MIWSKKKFYFPSYFTNQNNFEEELEDSHYWTLRFIIWGPPWWRSG